MGAETQEENQSRKKRNDLLLIGGILTGMLILVVVAWLVLARDGSKVVVMIDGSVVFEQELTTDCQIPIQTNQGYNVFRIENGIATIEEADCRDQICVEHIGIDKKGETIVCLPHKLIVEIR